MVVPMQYASCLLLGLLLPPLPPLEDLVSPPCSCCSVCLRSVDRKGKWEPLELMGPKRLCSSSADVLFLLRQTVCPLSAAAGGRTGGDGCLDPTDGYLYLCSVSKPAAVTRTSLTVKIKESPRLSQALRVSGQSPPCCLVVLFVIPGVRVWAWVTRYPSLAPCRARVPALVGLNGQCLLLPSLPQSGSCQGLRRLLRADVVLASP